MGNFPIALVFAQGQGAIKKNCFFHMYGFRGWERLVIFEIILPSWYKGKNQGMLKIMYRFLFVMAAIICFWSAPALALTEILNLRQWAAPDHTRVVIDADKEVQFTVEKSEKKVLLNLTNADILKTIPREFVLNAPGISRVVLTSLPKGTVRIELFLTDNADANVFKLKKFQDKPDRVVVDITLREVEKEQSRAREQIKVVKKDKIIVIDPGHGGEDPGAMGRRGTKEKDVVLAIGKKLRDVLNNGEGTRAFLTREGDYYVPFKKRVGIARELGADLFISVHADAAKNRSATGSSVYCLSIGGASSEAAKILAREENLADIIGGSFGDGNSNDESDPIILDMFQTSTINQSRIFGAKILSSLCLVNDIKFSHVQSAPFRVLKLPEIPAVLIETAYISNAQEERNLRNEDFQKKIARTIAGSVRDFFSLPEAVSPRQAKADEKTKGKDKKEDLKEGRAVSKKPAPEKGLSKGKAAKIVYKVKKGDTLGKIARKYQTQVNVLLKLNHMKLRDILYVDREIRLPNQTQ